MNKAFVIPDIHLKPWIFDKADILIKDDIDFIVFLGDLVDDWGQEKNIELYNKTFDRAEEFIRKYRDKIKWCYGNHDVSYLCNRLETGFSYMAQETVVRRMKGLKELLGDDIAIIHRIGNTLFSHAGLMESFVENIFPKRTPLNSMIDDINHMGAGYLWDDDSPLWARPQYDSFLIPYPENMYQVIGHTPLRKPLKTDNLLSVDVFSTITGRTPPGSQSYVIVDTETFDYKEVVESGIL